MPPSTFLDVTICERSLALSAHQQGSCSSCGDGALDCIILFVIMGTGAQDMNMARGPVKPFVCTRFSGPADIVCLCSGLVGPPRMA